MFRNRTSQLPRVILPALLAILVSACVQTPDSNQSVPDFTGTYDTATLTPLQTSQSLRQQADHDPS